jgi:hypothetical protein
MQFRNTTSLDSERLHELFRHHAEPWTHDRLNVVVRYSRGAEFSGTCYYGRHQIYINLGRGNRYPYLIRTHIARAQSNRRYWWKEIYTVEASDACQLALFVFLHEFYHWLIKRAKRNTRQKESMCDRFATRCLADAYGAAIRDEKGQLVARGSWDIQDVFGFVAGALPKRPSVRAARTVIHVPSGTQLQFDFRAG